MVIELVVVCAPTTKAIGLHFFGSPTGESVGSEFVYCDIFITDGFSRRTTNNSYIFRTTNNKYIVF
jgi:hypothetical protein